MCDAVRRHVLLTKPRKDGSTLHDHLDQAEKSGIPWPEEYTPLPPPQGLEHVWNIFWELRSTCGQGVGFGPTRISYLELDAWQRVTKSDLSQQELDCIVAMDSAYLAEALKK